MQGEVPVVREAAQGRAAVCLLSLKGGSGVTWQRPERAPGRAEGRCGNEVVAWVACCMGGRDGDIRFVF